MKPGDGKWVVVIVNWFVVMVNGFVEMVMGHQCTINGFVVMANVFVEIYCLLILSVVMVTTRYIGEGEGKRKKKKFEGCAKLICSEGNARRASPAGKHLKGHTVPSLCPCGWGPTT